MLNRKKRREENWYSYYFEKIGLIKACGINECNVVSSIIDGINDISVQTGDKTLLKICILIISLDDYFLGLISFY